MKIYPVRMYEDIYNRVTTSNQTVTTIKSAIMNLLEKAHEWEASLSQDEQTPYVTKSEMGAGQNIRV